MAKLYNYTPSVQYAQKQLDGLKADLRERLDRVEREIREAEQQGFVGKIPALEKHREWLERAYAGGIERATARLEEAKAAEIEKEQGLESRRQSQENILKERAKASWMSNGGSAESFESAWDGIRETLLTKRVVDDMGNSRRKENLPKIKL